MGVRRWCPRSLLIITLVGVGCRDRTPAPPPPTTVPAPTVVAEPAQPWQDDLALIGRELPARHPNLFARRSETEFRAALAELSAAIPTLTTLQRQVRLAQLIASIGDSHTFVELPAGPHYPASFAWFDDGLYVTTARLEDNWAVGRPVTAIAGRPADEALALVATVVAHENQSWLRAQVPWRFTDANLMVGLGLAGADRALELTVAAEAGPRTLRLIESEEKRFGALRVFGERPLAQRNLRSAYWSEYLPDARALFVQYNQCVESTPPFAKFVEEIVATIAAKPVDRLIVDLRNNSGGNSTLAAPLVIWLRDHPAMAARTLVLIGRSTFSSAILNALELEAVGARLVGEVAGGAPNHFGETTKLALPATGLSITHSTKVFNSPLHPGSELTPSIAIPVRAADVFARRDPTLEAALKAPVQKQQLSR